MTGARAGSGGPEGGPPAISAVVPCRNEVASIQECVESILRQEVPAGDFEVIVVDGMSDDGTRAVLDRLAAANPRLRVIDNPQRTTPHAMNRGIEAARGDYIAVMGAHNHYAPDYLRRCQELSAETGADNVGGVVVAEARTYMQRAIAASHHSWFSVGGSRWHSRDYAGPADTVWGGFYRREVFERVGMFDRELVRNQDDELNLRLTSAGGTIWQSPRIRSWYSPRSSLRQLFRQYRQYGYWKVRVIRKHGRAASWRHLVPAAFVGLEGGALALTLVGAVAAGRQSRWASWPALFLVLTGGAYAVADVVASGDAAAREGADLIPALLLVFPCYHLGYGLGFVEALVEQSAKIDRSRGMARLTR